MLSKRSSRYLLASLFTSICFVFGVSIVLAAPVRFDVTVNPNPLNVNEFADVTVKAIDANGNVDTTYTDGDIWIEVE